MNEQPSDNIRQTYLALRFATVPLVLMLFISVGIEVFANAPDCLKHSISAYYYTPARAVFVGALCAIGACLIIYRGTTDNENMLLDYSGFMAFIVAFVPTKIDATCTASNVPSPDEVSAAVQNTVPALLLVGLVGTMLAWFVKALRTDPKGSLSRYARISLTVTSVALIAGFLFFLFGWRDEFQKYGHGIAASALFVGIIGVAIENAVGFAKRTRGKPNVTEVATNRYSIIVAVMAVTVVGCFVAKGAGFRHWLFVLEALLIAEFAAFWIIQTIELGGQVSRPETQAEEPSEAVATSAT